MSLNYISLNNSKILNTNIKIFSWKKSFTHIFCSISENVQVNQNPKVISRNDYVFPLKRQDNLSISYFQERIPLMKCNYRGVVLETLKYHKFQ